MVWSLFRPDMSTWRMRNFLKVLVVFKRFSWLWFLMELAQKKSELKLRLWPMWLTIVKLPIAVRQSYPNLPLLAVYAGTEKPNWEKLEAIDFSSLKWTRKVIIKQKEVLVIWRLLYLVTDMVLKHEYSTTLNSMENLVVFFAIRKIRVEKMVEAGSIFLTKKWHCCHTLATWMMYEHPLKQTTPTSRRPLGYTFL